MAGFFRKLFGRGGGSDLPPAGTRTVSELAKRLGLNESDLRGVVVEYGTFTIPKGGGGTRTIAAPADPLKAVQRTILRKLLARLPAHDCATGFERGHSIVTNAAAHVGRDVVIRLDLQDFFTSTAAGRVQAYFRRIGWDADAAELLTKICTHKGSLPQGAPTSPRLSNLLNYRLDARLFALAQAKGVAYSRYADDITLSASVQVRKDRPNGLIHAVKGIVRDEGYALHTKKKLRIWRKHDRQVVTGLVVNQKVNLPRAIRRRLRAVEHHLKTGRPATLTAQQLAGWRALEHSIALQRGGSQNQVG